jgi:hypothetical protein
MYNAPKPAVEDLPTTPQLLRSTAIAIAAAAVILVTVVLPAEYNLDPTGIGKFLGLTEMGQIKAQLAEEAEADAAQSSPPLAVPAAEPQTPVDAGSVPQAPVAVAWTDEVTFTLEPGEGTEIKLVMDRGAVAQYDWMVTGGVVNFDTHGDGGGNSISYERGRAVAADAGELTAAFTGNHGWFWRNRGEAPVSVTLRVAGAYSDVKRLD